MDIEVARRCLREVDIQDLQQKILAQEPEAGLGRTGNATADLRST